MQDAIPLLYFFGLLATLMATYWLGMRNERRRWEEIDRLRMHERYRNASRDRWSSCNILDDPE